MLMRKRTEIAICFMYRKPHHEGKNAAALQVRFIMFNDGDLLFLNIFFFFFVGEENNNKMERNRRECVCALLPQICQRCV
jgi:hypothetical protein